jgi:hypothetical protein
LRNDRCVAAVAVDAGEPDGARGMHRRLVGRYVAGNTTYVLAIDVDLGLSQQIAVLRRPLRSAHPAFE